MVGWVEDSVVALLWLSLEESACDLCFRGAFVDTNLTSIRPNSCRANRVERIPLGGDNVDKLDAEHLIVIDFLNHAPPRARA